MPVSRAVSYTHLSKGQVLWEVSVEGPSSAPFIGRKYQHDEVFCYIATPWGEYEKIWTGFTGRVVEVCAKQGDVVNKGRNHFLSPVSSYVYQILPGKKPEHQSSIGT